MNQKKINLKDTVIFIDLAWKKINKAAITNSFKHSFLEQGNNELKSYKNSSENTIIPALK